MAISHRKEITAETPESRFFLAPENPLHRQYEALRAFFVEGLPSGDVAGHFGYSPGAFRVLCHRFRREAAAGGVRGAARLPGGGDDDPPAIAKPEPAPVADVRELDPSPRTFRTR